MGNTAQAATETAAADTCEKVSGQSRSTTENVVRAGLAASSRRFAVAQTYTDIASTAIILDQAHRAKASKECADRGGDKDQQRLAAYMASSSTDSVVWTGGRKSKK